MMVKKAGDNGLLPMRRPINLNYVPGECSTLRDQSFPVQRSDECDNHHKSKFNLFNLLGSSWGLAGVARC